MAKEIALLDDLYTTYQAMGLPVSDINPGDDFSIHDLKQLHPVLPFKSIGYRPNYFSFLFLKNARGRYTTDYLTFDTEPGTIYFTNPGHYKSFEWYAIEKAYLITFKESFLKEHVSHHIFKEFPFLLAETVYPKTLAKNAFQEFDGLCKQIYQEYHSTSVYKKKIVGSLMMVLLLKIKENFWREYDPIYEGNRSSQIVKNFKRNLENHFRELVQGITHQTLRVQDYADLQGLHAGYLNQIIKSKTGKPISVWIMEKTITEAKTLLLHSSLSIKEIAYRLGFLEVPHFSNYFKKYTNTSPAIYRNANRPS